MKKMFAFIFLFVASQASFAYEMPVGVDNSIVGEVAQLKSNPYCNTQVYKAMPVVENKNMQAKTKLGCYDNFTVLHSGISKTPLWSAEHLTKDNVLKGMKLERINSFRPESLLPESERAELSNFKKTGYDRGHMAPNKDMPTEMAQYQCFVLANMIPQDSNNNRVLWEHIEATTRVLAKKEGELYVVTGPLFLESKIGSLGGVFIPTHIFKAIYDPVKNEAAAYFVNNQPGNDYKVINIAELQRLSGIDVFPFLTKAQREKAATLPRAK